jgi:hypothetical protein
VGRAPRRTVPELVSNLWRGRLRLPVTYWLFGVGGNMSFVALLVAGYFMLGLDAAWLWAIYLLSLAWFVWIFVGIWRSVGRYAGPALLAVLARAGVCVGIVRMAGEAALLAVCIAPSQIS